ncbi:hypothetical protein NZK32_07815 [Cyanobium sp. FGCU-52]|nr:hypothetical protein [Cyanobium sp. FGCU52]
MSSPLAIAAFVLAGYAVIGNDALQTLGPFLAANRGRTPRLLQFAWLAVLLAAVLLLGWWWGEGDPAWGRLQTFSPLTDLRWVDLLPSLSVLLLTQWGAPVSTSFLVLTAVDPASVQPLLRHSLAGYGLGLAVGLLAWGALLWRLEGTPADQPPEGADGDSPSAASTPTEGALPLWLALQWITTGWLWSQWLVQDLANIYVYLPRRLGPGAMAGSLAVLLVGLALLMAENGGAIQQRLDSKTNSGDPRPAALLAGIYGLVLFAMGRISAYPLSTTWAFLGLLAGRELALLRLGSRDLRSAAGSLAEDLLRAALGLGISLAVALGVRASRGIL